MGRTSSTSYKKQRRSKREGNNMSDEMKDVCYGCGKVDVYGSMRDINDIEFDILCDACWANKEKELNEIDKQMKFMHEEASR
jgi:hypothetical protein